MGQGVCKPATSQLLQHPGGSGSPPLQACADALPTDGTAHAPNEAVPAPFTLEWAGSEAEVRAALRARASAAL